MIGTPVSIGFYPGSQSHLDERYFNNGVPYSSTDEVLTIIPEISRVAYLTVNIEGVEYWFLSDLVTLVPKQEYLAIANKAITLLKMADMASDSLIYRRSPGAGTPEVNTLEQLKTDLNCEPANINIQAHIADVTGNPHRVTKSTIGLDKADNTADVDKPISKSVATALTGKQNNLSFTPEDKGNKTTSINSESTDVQYPSAKCVFDLLNKNPTQTIFTLTLPNAQNVDGRIAGATFGTGAESFVLSVSGDSPNHLIITHNLNREIVDVKIKSTETAGITGKRLLIGSAPYSGIVATDNNTLRIENLTTVEKEITLHLIFA